MSRAVSSVSRVTKRQGCSGLKDLAGTLGPSLGKDASGRRLIRRVLSQLPGRTWEGKEELLEAVVALCAASKGSAVTLEPFFWGGADEPSGDRGGGSGTPSSSTSRGVKRSRSSDPLGSTEVEVEQEEEEEEEGRGEAANVQQEGGAGASAGAPGTAASAGSKGSVGGDGSGSDDNDGAANDDGGEEASPFEYQDKIGDLDGTALPPAAAVAGVSVHGQASQQAAGSGPSEEPRKDAALEEGLASLDVEDDSPIPFGEVVALMLAQLRR